MPSVISKDGTKIAYEKLGQGPALILVDGAMCYRSFGPMPGLAKVLAPHFTVTIYDRRGRGESSNSRPPALEREVNDLEALIQEAGGSAFLYGISSGACLALEAAVRLGHIVEKLALYEPPYDASEEAGRAWKEFRKQMEGLLASDRQGEAVELFLKFMSTPVNQIKGMRQSPAWPLMEAIAPTLENDFAAIGEDRSIPTRRAAAITTPTLILNGSAMAFMQDTAIALAKVIPHARQKTLDGQTHDVDPNVLAQELISFFTE